jgi:hypothetical protein
MNRELVDMRIMELLDLVDQPAELERAVHEERSGTVSLLTAIYGPTSIQLKTFLEATTATTMSMGRGGYFPSVIAVVGGTLRTLRADLEVGLTATLRGQVAGEIVGDFLGLARGVLADKSEGATHVAFVLVAAAFEDTLRRLCASKGIPHEEKLADVVAKLKDGQFLVGTQVPVALSYLKFRNDALHARWTSIERASVMSALGFVEELILKHFS